MSECADKICLIIFSCVASVLCYDIVMVDEPLEEYDGLRIVEWTFFVLGLHMPLIERSVHNRTKSRRSHELIYLARGIHNNYE